jgi:hypothetical protein
MLKINKIEQPKCQLFTKDGIHIGEISSYIELLDIQVQVKKLELPTTDCAYYIVFSGEKIYLDSDGRLSHHPDGFYYELHNNLMIELL